MKRYLIILMVISIVFSFPLRVFGDTNAAPSVMKISLDQAYTSLEANNVELKLLDKRIEISQIQYNDAVENAKDAKSMVSSDGEKNIQYRKTQSIYPQLAMLDLDTSRNNRAEKLKLLKRDVKQQYFNILFLQNEKQFISEDIASIDKELEETTLRIKMGQATETNYKSIYSQKLSVQNQFNAINTQLQTALINFKRTVGIELSQPIELENLTLPNQVVDKNNIKDNILKAIDKDFSMQQLKRQLEIKEDERQIVKQNTYYKYSMEYTDLSTEVDELQAELNYAKLNLEAELWAEYFDILVLEDNVKLAQINEEIERINYDTMVSKAKLGMVNAMAEMNAKTSYNRAKNNLQRETCNYIIAVEQFNDKVK